MIRDFLAALSADLLPDGDDRQAADALIAAIPSGGETGCIAALRLARLIGEAAEPTAVLEAADRMMPEASDAVTVAVRLLIACFATVRADYPARQDAAAARSRLGARADASYPVLSNAGAETLDWLVRLVGEAVSHLSAVAASRVPLVRVETGISLPSTLAAYDLYGDATRAGEIVARNRSATPMIMPSAFEAAAS